MRQLYVHVLFNYSLFRVHDILGTIWPTSMIADINLKEATLIFKARPIAGQPAHVDV